MAGILYTYPNNFRAQKALITAQYSGQKVTVDPDFVIGETDKSAEFLKKFPLGKVPAYESDDVRLSEANAIAYHVGNEQTRGGDKEAEVLQWIGFADNVILPAACTWVYPTQGILQYNKQNTEKAKAELKDALTVLNNHLSTRTFLVGERVTQADISLACNLVMLYVHVMDAGFRSPFGNVTRWFVTLINQPEFKAVLGEVDLCEKMAQFDAKKYNEIHGRGEKKEKTPKQKGGGGGDAKSPQPKKQQQPAQSEQPPAEKKKDPWASLPETEYDMDEFKRIYSNDHSETKEESLKYFWDKFDKEKYSLYRGLYKYGDELRVKFMVSNLIEGMMQRIEKMRKHSFGLIAIMKKDGVFVIDGLWFWRGQGLAFELDDSWQIDYDTYDWVKLDPDSDDTKLKVQEYFREQGDFGGCELLDMKCYK